MLLNPLSGNSFSPVSGNTYSQSASGTDAVGSATDKPKNGYKSSPGECQTCKNRKYIDGSNEGNVSFKTPGHISPSESAARVMSHEREHVANAISEASAPNATLLNASVSLHTSICPECGTPYVSGGVTHTTIKYDMSNPYQAAKKSMDATVLPGQNFEKAMGTD